MLETIVNYYKDNPMLFKVTLIVFLVCLIVGFGAVLAYNAVRSAKERKSPEDAAAEIFGNADLDNGFVNETPAEDDNETESPDAAEEENSAYAVITPTETVEKAPETENADDALPAETENESAPINEQPIKREEPTTKPTLNSENDKSAPEKETATASRTAEKDEKQKRSSTRYAGKWIITESDGMFSANLVASNGEVLLRSESYSALSGVKSGIDTINKNIAKNNFALSIDKNGKYFFKLYSSSKRLLCISEVYGSKKLCDNAVESVKRFSQTAIIVRQSETEQ